MQFGQTSVISSDGVFIAVGTAASNNGYYNLVYMYKKDVVTGRFRCAGVVCCPLQQLLRHCSAVAPMHTVCW